MSVREGRIYRACPRTYTLPHPNVSLEQLDDTNPRKPTLDVGTRIPQGIPTGAARPKRRHLRQDCLQSSETHISSRRTRCRGAEKALVSRNVVKKMWQSLDWREHMIHVRADFSIDLQCRNSAGPRSGSSKSSRDALSVCHARYGAFRRNAVKSWNQKFAVQQCKSHKNWNLSITPDRR